MIEVAIDTAADIAGVALSEQGALVAEVTWRSRQNHSRELLPTLDWLLSRSGFSKTDIGAVFVCTGPGSYAGLRVGLSTAKAFAYALAIPIVGVGRLAADARPFVAAGGPRVYAVHAAGRAELAWAAYEADGDGMREAVAPRLSKREALATEVAAGSLVCGELDAPTVEALRAGGAVLASPAPARVVAVARLGWLRLRRGDVDSAESLVPLYLREPAIGPQT